MTKNPQDKPVEILQYKTVHQGLQKEIKPITRVHFVTKQDNLEMYMRGWVRKGQMLSGQERVLPALDTAALSLPPTIKHTITR